MADPLLSGRVPTQRSNKSPLLRSNHAWIPGRANQRLQFSNPRCNGVRGQILTETVGVVGLRFLGELADFDVLGGATNASNVWLIVRPVC